MTKKMIGVFLGLFFAVSMNVCAMEPEDEPTLIQEAMSKMSDTKAERLSEIEELMNDNLFRTDTNVFRMDGYQDKITEYDLEGAYQVYILEPLLVTAYDETGSFSETITDSVQWKIPIKTESGTPGLAVVNESDIGLTFSGTIVGDTSSIWYVNEEKIIASVNNAINMKGPIESICIVHSYMYYTTFVYLYGSDAEYLIPYSIYADKLNLENGKVYSVSDVMKAFNKCFDESEVINNPDNNGGVPFRRQGITVYGAALVTVASILLIIALVFFLLKTKGIKK
ncbi:MAG: hypothetical protein NC123_05325 [Butyrivibrio sp.]|nr:hypothetical protein [Acetatifactor muris]MCM1558949.1 hypothetical protein [Butyrivibrio sp.]